VIEVTCVVPKARSSALCPSESIFEHLLTSGGGGGAGWWNQITWGRVRCSRWFLRAMVSSVRTIEYSSIGMMGQVLQGRRGELVSSRVQLFIIWSSPLLMAMKVFGGCWLFAVGSCVGIPPWRLPSAM
jgi:hypothetical protein